VVRLGVGVCVVDRGEDVEEWAGGRVTGVVRRGEELDVAPLVADVGEDAVLDEVTWVEEEGAVVGEMGPDGARPLHAASSSTATATPAPALLIPQC
jgi:hypothetical protein